MLTGFLSIYAFLLFPMLCLVHVTRRTDMEKPQKFGWGASLMILGPLAGLVYALLATKSRWLRGSAFLATLALALGFLDFGKAVSELNF